MPGLGRGEERPRWLREGEDGQTGSGVGEAFRSLLHLPRQLGLAIPVQTVRGSLFKAPVSNVVSDQFRSHPIAGDLISGCGRNPPKSLISSK